MPADLLLSPRCNAVDLGLPMPDDLHAVSACLPLWQHNIGYEEGDSEVIDRLQAAYPRFCFHPFINQLCEQKLNSPQHRGLPFASEQAARRAVEYVAAGSGQSGELIPLCESGVTGVVVAEDHFGLLKQYWQHAGENASSRVAEEILNGRNPAISETDARVAVRKQVAEIQEASEEHVFLYPSGMAAIAAAWRIVKQLRGASSCQFGFPYVDTLKIQQRFPGASHCFFPCGDENELQQLRRQCQTNPPAVLFCEVPTNPLLVTPDLTELRQLADEYDILLVVDDTLAACGNLSVTSLADIVVTSLTKYFSGRGNVLAGALTINPAGRHAGELRATLLSEFEETLSDIDTEVLRTNAADLKSRVARINSNAAELVHFLRQHDAVADVFYPTSSDASYEELRRKTGGYGGLFSIVLKAPEESTPPMFDSLQICKGPNLGTDFTLCCPYTILAHYGELEFAESCGVSRWLLRVSVGLEPVEELKRRFAAALSS